MFSFRVRGPGDSRFRTGKVRALDSFERDLYGLNKSLLIKFHFVDADHSVVAIGFAERTPMIDDVVLLLAGQLDNGMVTCAGGDGGILLQDFANAFERAQEGVGYCIGDGIIRSGPTTF